eukprot:gene9503-9581_t
MSHFLIQTGTWILVGDGRKALFLRNIGTAEQLELTVERVLESENAPTSEQGSDRPGRSFSSMGYGRSAYEETDWHEIGEQRFVTDVAQALVKLASTDTMKALILVVPAKVLGQLNDELPPMVQNLVVDKLTRDLTKHPVAEIARFLAA